MANVGSTILNGAQGAQILHYASNSHIPRSSISLRSQLRGSSKSWLLKRGNGGLLVISNVSARKAGKVRVSASVAAAEKPSMAPEMVLQPIKEISGTVTLPGSKSLSNRILLLAALSEGTTVVDNLLNSEDVHYMLGALRTLGLHVEEDSAIKQAIVEGCGGKFPVGIERKDEVKLFLGNAGTAMRPLTAAVTTAGGHSSYVLDGVPRMRERPIGDLVTGLKQLGADVDCFLGTNCPPVRVIGKGGLPGGKVRPVLYLGRGCASLAISMVAILLESQLFSAILDSVRKNPISSSCN